MSETCNPALSTAEQDPIPPDLFKIVAERADNAFALHKNNQEYEYILESETKGDNPVPVIKFCLADTYENFRHNKGEVLEVSIPLFIPESDDPMIDRASAIPMLSDLNPNRYFTIFHHNDRNTREFLITDRGVVPSREWSLFPRRLRRHKPSGQYVKHLRDKLIEFELIPLRRRNWPDFEVDEGTEDNTESDD